MYHVMGIETSCDETSVSVMNSNSEVLSNSTFSQIDIHKKYGGVVPEIASKNHLEKIIPVIDSSLLAAKKNIEDIDYLCVTNGPGLINCLMIGVATSKSIGLLQNIPVIPINHLEGHIASCFIENSISFPSICLVASGGHTNLYLLENENNFNLISSTRDDAAGEAFDKGAKILQLGYPGGIEIDRLSKKGSNKFHSFPIPNLESDFDFSFSGLKTSLRYYVEKNKNWKDNINDISCCYQEAIVDSLLSKTVKAADKFKSKNILFAGGVACNSRLRDRANEIFKNKAIFPSNQFCTDNGAMIAMRGLQKIKIEKTDYDNSFPVFSSTKITSNLNLD
jgi:N6-L-threonylcarbamoyladenine synthase